MNNYSRAMKKQQNVWTQENLVQFFCSITTQMILHSTKIWILVANPQLLQSMYCKKILLRM